MQKVTLRYMSDLHLSPIPGVREFHNYLPEMDDEDQQILLLCGDIGEKLYQVEFIIDMIHRFKHVVYIFGNHEHYKFNIQKTHDLFLAKMRDLLGHIPETFHLLDADEVVIDGIVFLGATLWTDFNNDNPISKMYAKDSMYDYHAITNTTKIGGRDWTSSIKADDIYDIHCAQLEYIKMRLSYWHSVSPSTPIVIMSHHAPSFMSVHEKYQGQSGNEYFYSSLEYVVDGYNVPFWFHGHTHTQFDYMMYDTRVLCNPKGYSNFTKGGVFYSEASVALFNPFATVEIMV